MIPELQHGYLFEKVISNYPQRKRYELTSQEVKLLMCVSSLARTSPQVPTRRIYVMLKGLNHTVNYKYLKITLNKLTRIGLLISRVINSRGYYRYNMSLEGKLFVHSLESFALKEFERLKSEFDP